MEIYKPIDKSISKLDLELKNMYGDLSSTNIKEISDYFFSKKGKYLRPSLAFLSAGAIIDNVENENLIKLGLSLELLHSASLIHDDIIDEDDFRRGQKTLNNVYGNKIAVLAGDIFYAYSHSIINKNFPKEYSEEIANLSFNMCNAEIAQAKGVSGNEEYFNMIKGKTALFTSICCKLGAMHSGATTQQAESLEEFGLYFGMAYQIKDDFLDGDLPQGVSVTIEDAKEYANRAKDAAKGIGNNMYVNHLCELMDYVV